MVHVFSIRTGTPVHDAKIEAILVTLKMLSFHVLDDFFSLGLSILSPLPHFGSFAVLQALGWNYMCYFVVLKKIVDIYVKSVKESRARISEIGNT